MMTFESRLEDVKKVIEDVHDMCGDIHGDIAADETEDGKKVLDHLGATRSMVILHIAEALQMAYDMTGLAIQLEEKIAEANGDPTELARMSKMAGMAALMTMGPQMFGAVGFKEAKDDE